jgi:hypothetical protein
MILELIFSTITLLIILTVYYAKTILIYLFQKLGPRLAKFYLNKIIGIKYEKV